MPEMLDIVDENGLPTGQAVPRTVAHAEGLRHRTSHVWIVRKKNGAVQVHFLTQQEFYLQGFR